jgi:lysozyme
MLASRSSLYHCGGVHEDHAKECDMNLIASGPDVSSVQGAITAAHWAACAKSSDFVIIKCGDGNNGFDHTYSQNIQGARNAGLIVGTYHYVFVLPDQAGHPGRSPEEQADAHFAKAVYMPGDLIPWADFEWPLPQDWDHWGLPKGKSQRAEFIGDFIVRYTSRYSKISGRSIGVYSYPDWIEQSQVANTTRYDALASLPFWRAGPYGSSPPNAMPGGLGPWDRSDIYQWTGGHSHMPNGTPCDWNICVRSRLEWLSVMASRK